MTGVEAPRLRLAGVVLAGAASLDLAVASGELVAIVGWDSSDLLGVVAGLVRPESGIVTIDGVPIDDRIGAADRGVVLMPQSGALAMLLTAYENVLLPLLGRPGGDVADSDPPARARRALELVGLADSADHLVEELSGGQQQRVAIARTLAARPRVLLADQVTTDLDPANRTRVLDLLRDLAAGGAAVLLASDDPAVIEACDRSVSI